MNATTIKVHTETKSELDKFREYRNESYDEVIHKLVHIAKHVKDEPELSRKTIESIESARERIKKGNFVSEAEMAKRLGL